MPFPNFVDPPTKETLVNARRSLEVTRASVEEITSKIDAAEMALAQLVRDSRLAISELEGQRAALEDQVSKTLAYLSPIRRLPMELLREIFVWSFEEHACSAWVLAAVCPSWRRLALRIPLIWSKVSPFYTLSSLFFFFSFLLVLSCGVQSKYWTLSLAFYIIYNHDISPAISCYFLPWWFRFAPSGHISSPQLCLLHPRSPLLLRNRCYIWRTLVPLQIRLLTTQHSSADTIRLWLERSGESVPLDIEIFLRVARPGSEATPPCPRRVASSPLLAPITPPWNTSSHQQVAPQYMIPHAPPPASVANVTIVMPPSPPSHQDSWSTGGNTSHGHDRSPNAISRSSMHWGHIAFFYLVEQMHRWERFIFRFDKQFTSMGALKAINGEVFPIHKLFAELSDMCSY